MLTIETERRVAKLLSEISHRELLSQEAKYELTSNNLFNPYLCYKFIDNDSKNKIEPYDIVTFMQLNREYCSLHEAYFIILFNSPEHCDYLSYSNFVNFLLSGNDLYSNITNIKEFNYNERERIENSKETIDNYMQSLLVKVFKREIELIRNCQPLVDNMRKRYDFDINDMFNSITGGASISINNLKEFLIRNGVYFEDNEILAIINRLNIDKNGRVGLHEIKRIFDKGFSKVTAKEMIESLLKGNKDNLDVGYMKNDTMKFWCFDKINYKNTNSNNNNNEELPLENSNLNLRISPFLSIQERTINDYENNNTHSSNEDNFISISVKEENILLDFFKTIQEREIIIEKSKSELALRADFNIIDAYKIFESNNLGYLTLNDLSYGFQSLNIEIQNVKLLMRLYDLSNQGYITLNNFFDMLVPYAKEYRTMVESRTPMNYTPRYNKSEVFLNATLYLFRNLIKLIYISEDKINIKRSQIEPIAQIFMRKIFTKMDKDSKGYITPNDLGQYMKDNKLILFENECALMFIRLDRNRDGKVTINDFFFEMTPVN